MTFDMVEFGDRIRTARLKKEYSLEYLASMLGKSVSTVSRYEKGKIQLNAETISKICEVLEIYIDDLYEITQDKVVNAENSNNPFKVDRLYLYYLGYRTKNKIAKYRLVIDIVNNSKVKNVTIHGYDDDKIILSGHMLADNCMVSIRTENYKSNCPRLETNQIILNISGGTNGLIRGVMMCTNGEYVPNIKKCIVSKKDVSFDEEIERELRLTEVEKKRLIKNGIWMVDISKSDFDKYGQE